MRLAAETHAEQALAHRYGRMRFRPPEDTAAGRSIIQRKLHCYGVVDGSARAIGQTALVVDSWCNGPGRRGVAGREWECADGLCKEKNRQQDYGPAIGGKPAQQAAQDLAGG